MKTIFCAILALFALSAQAVTFNIDGPCSGYYSPHGGGEAAIVKLVGSARQSVKVLAFSFTSKPIANALIAAHANGVAVEIILDKSQLTAKGSQLGAVLSAGIPVWIDSKHAIAHNKVMVVDGKWFETGSFNYTASAENANGENVTICPSTEGAAAFTADFERHKLHSEKQP